MNVLDPILAQISKLWSRVDLMPTLRWGTVNQVSPLQVTLDGDAAALPFPPQSAVQGLAIGARVVCVEQNRRVVAIASSSEAIGLVNAFAGTTAPGGWLLCDGAEVSRTTYSALFTVIGTAYGAGNGTSTFNLPNLKGRVPVGRDAAQTEFDVLGETGGAKAHTLTVAEIPSHVHDQYVTAATGGGTGIRKDYVGDGTSQAYPQGITTGGTGGGGAHNNLQPYVVTNYIIKAF